MSLCRRCLLQPPITSLCSRPKEGYRLGCRQLGAEVESRVLMPSGNVVHAQREQQQSPQTGLTWSYGLLRGSPGRAKSSYEAVICPACDDVRRCNLIAARRATHSAVVLISIQDCFPEPIEAADIMPAKHVACCAVVIGADFPLAHTGSKMIF